tara:strand:+ start:97 stop:1785 length:1689 start_codon:yes stop_codon:yes gene_type:complete
VSNFYIEDDRFAKQDSIRTIHLSFKPHLPFTAAYEMALQNAGGGKLVSDPNKGAYFRVGARDIQGSTNPDSTSKDNQYPWSKGHPLSRREIYRGVGSGRLTIMAQSQNREEAVLSKLPNTRSATSLLGQQLADLLNVDYKTKNPIATRESQRDIAEMELKMIARGFDNISQGGGGGPGQNLNENFQPTYGDRKGKGFDIDLSKYSQLSDYIEETMGGQYSELEITTDSSKFLSNYKGVNETTNENKTKWHEHIDKKFSKYNKTLRDAFAKLQTGGEGGAPALQGTQYFEFARDLATKPGQDSKSDDYQLRQILDRAARNVMRPYIFQSQLGPDKMGLVAITPSIVADVPQFERGPTTVIDNASSVMEGLTEWMKIQDKDSIKKINTVVTDAKRKVRDTVILTEARIATLEKHAQAIATLEGGQIDTVLSSDGPDQVHKIQYVIAQKMLADIDAYFKSSQMTQQFKSFYDGLIRYSNNLTKAWFRASSTLVGNVTGEPLSDEFKYGKAWNGPRKKYLGVWSSPDVDTWKGANKGYNFSVAPLLESRRSLSSNLGISSSYNSQE